MKYCCITLLIVLSASCISFTWASQKKPPFTLLDRNKSNVCLSPTLQKYRTKPNSVQERLINNREQVLRMIVAEAMLGVK